MIKAMEDEAYEQSLRTGNMTQAKLIALAKRAELLIDAYIKEYNKPNSIIENTDTKAEPYIGWAKVIQNMEETHRDWNEYNWLKKVVQGGEWDYKSSRVDATASERERAGNINYGATCRAAGHDPETCLLAGGFVQMLTDYRSGRIIGSLDEVNSLPGPTNCYGEPMDDCENIAKGMKFYDDSMRSKGK